MPVVAGLCVLTFLAGRFLQQSTLLPDPNVPTEKAPTNLPRRAVVEVPTVSREVLPASFKAPVSCLGPEFDPLDPAKFEAGFLELSGLNAVRPPVTPALSGDNFYRMIPFQILSWYPRIVVFPGFIDKKRCNHIVDMANRRLFPSGLAYRAGEKIDSNQEVRTSKGTFLSAEEDSEGVLAWVEERIAAATLLPAGYGEAFNVLRYEDNQHYDSHYDTFDPKDFGPQPSQRIATVLLYLSEVEEGGETSFLREGRDNGEKVISDWRACDDSVFKYKPRMGDAVLFWATKPNGVIDPHALHGGCPVKKGIKWVATKWIRSQGRDGPL